ncbi:MAG: hypothetical protein E6248_09465 [Clostridium sp.]|uniref:5' nucleotidase, NT5C type n=1 Tax=Clostridium sp. TaxID=1506 RepID=UPI0029149E55|nr:hypothetical protein [Clostridium sp.]MDU5110665.1 hypothetical protein [Clostridium sp.]
MKKLNICIDIDGTITEPYYWLDCCNKHFKTNITEKDVTKYSISEVIGVSEESYLEFYEKYKHEIHSTQKIRDDVKIIIDKLMQFSNLHFVTAREKDLALITHEYLRNNSIHYDNLFLLGSHYKVNKAKELYCDVFIEDNYKNAIELSEAGFYVLLLDTNYNRKPLNSNIKRVYNWIEVYRNIKSLFLEMEAI